MRDNSFNKIIRQCSFKNNTDNVNFLFNQAFALFTKHYKWEKPLRSVGVRVDNLESAEQLFLFPHDECELAIDIDSRVKKLTEKFGILQVEKTATIKEFSRE